MEPSFFEDSVPSENRSTVVHHGPPMCELRVGELDPYDPWGLGNPTPTESRAWYTSFDYPVASKCHRTYALL